MAVAPPNIFSKVFNNPIINGMVGLLGLLSSIFFYFASIKEALPAFAIMTNVVITNSADDSNVRIFYKNKSVSNVKLMRAIIWNAGTDIIDKHDFIGDGLINIVPSKSIDVLDFKVLRSSRSELKFTVDSSALNDNKLKIGIVGDEVLESKDGMIIQVLYSSASNVSWYVKGRIKGLPKGFYSFNSEPNIFYDFYKRYSNTMLGVFIIPALYVTIVLVKKRHNVSNVYKRQIVILVIYWLLLLVFAFLPEPSVDTIIPDSLKI